MIAPSPGMHQYDKLGFFWLIYPLTIFADERTNAGAFRQAFSIQNTVRERWAGHHEKHEAPIATKCIVLSIDLRGADIAIFFSLRGYRKSLATRHPSVATGATPRARSPLLRHRLLTWQRPYAACNASAPDSAAGYGVRE